ncbi:MAG: TrmH family RNA methyltransferase [Spirochaetaceae bacterium]|nr:MAG: TrmH family RNA methyltransferase [Spirochaetaceae bacterium]
MIAVRKLAQMPESTGMRKAARQLESLVHSGMRYDAVDRSYLLDLIGWLASICQKDANQDFRSLGWQVDRLEKVLRDDALEEAVCRRELDNLRAVLLACLGMEPAEWDLLAPEQHLVVHTDSNDRQVSPIAHLALYLDGIRSPFNVGSILRTADAMGVRSVYLSPDTTSPEHQRARRSAMNAVVSWDWLSPDDLPEREPLLVALETGGQSIADYSMPAEPFCLILGSEELGIQPSLLNACQGRVSLPMFGSKASLNVGAAAAAALQVLIAQSIRVAG